MLSSYYGYYAHSFLKIIVSAKIFSESFGGSDFFLYLCTVASQFTRGRRVALYVRKTFLRSNASSLDLSRSSAVEDSWIPTEIRS